MPLNLTSKGLLHGQTYNVSIVLKDGEKVYDNFRFFQATVPKMFAEDLSAYSTLSTITNSVTRSDKTNDDSTEPALKTSGVSSINVTKYNIAAEVKPTYTSSEYTFEFDININGNPSTLVYLKNFTSYLSFLNGQTLTVHKGNATMRFSGAQIAPNATYTRATGKFGGEDAKKLEKFFDKTKPTKKITDADALGSAEYMAGTYKPASVTSTYTRTSSIKTNIRNANVLDSLYWDDNVKDYVYFFISSNASGPWYYFKENKDIVVDNNASITGNDGSWSSSGPKTLTFNEFDNLEKDYVSGASCTFFQGSKQENDNFGIPNVYVRFAIARYIKDSATGTVTSSWLGKDTKTPQMSNIERLDGK